MTIPQVIEETSLSEAWCKVLERILANGEITPLVLTISEFNEDADVKDVLNADLIGREFNPIDMVAETIFPNSLYNFLDRDRNALYKTYIKNIPRIRKIDKRNAGGTYFERLIAFGGEKNQLEVIISSIIKNNVKRRSKLQACTFDPMNDHKEGAFQGFPCLQQITFYKSKKTGGLILNCFYAVQYLHQKAYGNWLGLINLGKFVASETNLTFERFNCFVGVEQLGPEFNKTQARELLKKINEVR